MFSAFFQTLANAFPILKKKTFAVLLFAIVYIGLLGGMLLLNIVIQGGVDLFKISYRWENVFSTSVLLGVQALLDIPMFILSCKMMEKKLNLE